MKKFIWSLGYALQRLGCAVQKATGWKPARKKAATGKAKTASKGKAEQEPGGDSEAD